MSAGRVSQTDSMQQESYRETISRRSESDFTHKKILDNGGEFARVVIQLEPLERGAGREFVNAMSNGALPPDFIEGVQQGICKAAQSGVLYGYPVVDFRATLLDGVYHEMDSNLLAFSLAAEQAFWIAMRNAGPKVLLRYE